MKKNNIIFLAKIIFIIVVFYYLFQKVPLSDILATVRQAKILPLFSALLLFTAIRIITALKWNILLRHHGIHEPFLHIVNIIFTSQFIGMIFPTSLGVDAVRFVQIQRNKKDLTASAGSIVADRILAVASLALLSILSATLLYFFSSLENKRILMPAFYFAPPFLFGFLFLMTPLPQKIFNFSHKTTQKFLNRDNSIITKIINKAETMHLMLYELKKNKMLFSSICLLNIIVQLGRVAEYYILFIALDVVVNPYYAIAVTPIIILLVLLPISPMGLGVKESAFIYFFTQIGVSPDISITVSLLSHFLQFGGIIPGAFLFLKDKKTKEKSS